MNLFTKNLDGLIFNGKEFPIEDLYFFKILDSLPDAIILKDAETLKYVYVNDTFQKLIGYSKEDILEKTNYEIYSKELADYYTSYDQKLLNTQKTIEIEEELHKTKSNEIKVFETKKVLIKSFDNHPKYILDISRDITENTKTKKYLEEVELRFLKMFELSPVGIIIFRATDFTVIDSNNSLLDFLEINKDQIIGKNLYDLDYFQNKQVIIDLFNQLNTENQSHTKEIQIQSTNNIEKSALMSLGYIDSESLEPWIICMLLNITETKAAIKELELIVEKEKDLNILKTRFISMISHEMRTPLTSIMLSTDLLKRYEGTWSLEERQKHFDRIQKTVLNLTHLMENVLTIGRLEAGKFELSKELIDLVSLSQAIIENVQLARGVIDRIDFVYKGGCGNAKVDENLVVLIITNLLSNAIKYSNEDSKITLELSGNDNEVIFKVMDKGIGIPTEDKEKIFDTFYRGSNTNGIYGYGLGLSIVKKCVEAHNGRIILESMENVGTTFTVILPK
ncbi:MAG: ATP-binding protein [Candidatus Kapabacteria bacterium]|nr:ATP-binding protein [Candidatus Kapabacteria bacterium]